MTGLGRPVKRGPRIPRRAFTKAFAFPACDSIGNQALQTGESTSARHNRERLLELGHMRGWQVSAPLAAGVDHGLASDQRSGTQNTIAADLGLVADDGSKLAQASGDAASRAVNADDFLVESHIGKDHARAQMRLVADDRISDIIEMRNLRFVEDEAVFKLAGVPGHHAVSENDILADVAPIANLAVLADPCRAFHHRALLDDGVLADENRAAHKGLADEAALDAGLHAEFQISPDLRQDIPNIFGILEKSAMLAVAEVKKIFDRIHGINAQQLQRGVRV